MNLPILPHDKANHIVYGVWIYILTDLFFLPIVALSIAFLFALTKELYDEKKYKGFDFVDLVVTMICPFVLFFKDIYL